jgi:hypothetical protein
MKGEKQQLLRLIYLVDQPYIVRECPPFCWPFLQHVVFHGQVNTQEGGVTVWHVVQEAQ